MFRSVAAPRGGIGKAEIYGSTRRHAKRHSGVPWEHERPCHPRVGGRGRCLYKKACAAASDPQGYYASHEKEFNERGIDEAQAGLYQIVLLDGLLELGMIVEMDWKLDADELGANIARLSGEKSVGKDVPQKGDMGSALDAIDRELKDKGKTLLQWVTDTDSYLSLGCHGGRVQ